MSNLFVMKLIWNPTSNHFISLYIWYLHEQYNNTFVVLHSNQVLNRYGSLKAEIFSPHEDESRYIKHVYLIGIFCRSFNRVTSYNADNVLLQEKQTICTPRQEEENSTAKRVDNSTASSEAYVYLNLLWFNPGFLFLSFTQLVNWPLHLLQESSSGCNTTVCNIGQTDCLGTCKRLKLKFLIEVSTKLKPSSLVL